jgi:hypothetical protein
MTVMLHTSVESMLGIVIPTSMSSPTFLTRMSRRSPQFPVDESRPAASAGEALASASVAAANAPTTSRLILRRSFISVRP